MSKRKLPSKYARVTVRTFKIKELKDADYNARTISQAALNGLSKSLETLGVLALPVVNVAGGKPVIVGGHQRVRVMRERGDKTVECIVVELSADEERQANLALNNHAIQGSFVPALAREVLNRLREIGGADIAARLSELRIDTLMRGLVRSLSATGGVDDVVRKGKVDDEEDIHLGTTLSMSQPGVIYRLGEHQVYCGKLAEPTTLERFGLVEADMGITRLVAAQPFDPEYLHVYLGTLLSNVNGGIYVGTSLARWTDVASSFRVLGGHLSSMLVAFRPEEKGSAKESYRDVTLPLLYGWRVGTAHYSCGDRSQGTVWHLNAARPPSDLPVEVAVRAILNSSKVGGVVLDTNLASGATVIAAEKTGRRLVGFASSPRAVDAVRCRWARFRYGPKVAWAAKTPAMEAPSAAAV